MSCNIRVINGKEVGFTDAGTPSQLFKDAVNKLGEKEGKDVFFVSLSDDFKETIPPAEKYDPKRIARRYTELITQVKKDNPEDYWSVDVPTAAEINSAAEAGRIVDTKGGMGIVTEDGNLVGLFKYDQSQKGTAEAVQAARVKMGGIKLDNYDSHLTRTYQKNGFRVVARVPFSEEHAPEGWNKEKHGTPDVAFMVYDPNNKLDIQERTLEDYDEAKAYRDTYVEAAKVGHPAYSISPSNSSNYANLTEDGKGNFVFYHVGADGYKTIKPASGNTIFTSREEAAALSKVGGMAMYYTGQNEGEGITGDSRYLVKVPMENVYDFNTDPLNLVEKAKSLHTKENPGKAFDSNTQVAYVTKLAGELGYKMTVSEWNGRTRAQTTEELAPDDFQDNEGNRIVKPFKKDYASNRERGYISSIPKSKESSLQDVYSRINKERNAQNRYDSLYHLAASPKPSQEEITEMIMQSDISSELKSRYQDILRAPIQKRQSFRVEEPALEDVMQYITAQNEVKEPMNVEQTQDYKNTLISTKGFTFENLKEAFFDENGVFFISTPKLVSSGLYSQYEAEHLKKDLELQEKVKASIEALKNTEEVVVPTQEDFEQVEKENSFNSFGKLNNLNPYIVQKQIQNTLAATTREEFDELLGELPFSNFQKSVQSESAKESLFKDMQAFKKAEMMLSMGGEIKPSLNSNTAVVIPQVSQDLTGKKVLNDIKYFLEQDLNILKANPKETRTLLESIEKNLIKEGYDVIGLASKTPNVYMMQYLSSVADLSEESNKEALDNYVSVYDEYFGNDLTPEKGYIKTAQDDRVFVKLDTELKEEDVYNQQGFIKQSEGVYIRVNKKTADELYPIVATYPEKLPEGVKTEEDLRKYIQSTLNNDEVTNSETGEVINLFKLYYGIPLEVEPKKINTEEFNQKQSQFDGDADYLKGDFVSDFYRDGLVEKAKESKLYRDFYSHFKVTEKGLELENNDPITLESIKPYVTDDLKNYSLLSKSMPNLKPEEVDFVDGKNSRRDLISNNPTSLAKFEGNISLLDDNNLVAKNSTNEFIRLKNDVYEKMQTIGNLSLYSKLGLNKGAYNSFAVEKPESGYSLDDYLHLENKPESFIKAKNYLSKEEKDGLDADEFSCL